MSVSVLLLLVIAALGAGAWMMFGSKGDDAAGDTAGEGGAKAAGSFSCRICGASSPTFLAAHEHASAEHDLAGHKIDESIEAR
ncbi:MAG: hypothetical protein HYY35_04345 [Deltaproteobacteria bacterium]|nr:hypothetical protein [Deltaproteobacteria bacterium]